MDETEIPLCTAEVSVAMDDGAIISLRRWGAPDAERVVISHGNGLAIDAFARFGKALVARGFEVIAFDMRNHGRNPFRPTQEANWTRFIKDFPAILAGIAHAFGDRPTHGAFHSLSSVACLLSQSANPYPWRTLTLFEPPIPPAPGSPVHDTFLDFHKQLSGRAAGRRSRFASPGELASIIRRSSLFRLVPDADVERLARATVREDGEGAWVLCCTPEFEAATFRIEAVEHLRPGIARIDCPVRLAVGDQRIHYAGVLVETGRELARDFGFEILELREATHFMQLEKPAVCAGLVAGGVPVEGDLNPDALSHQLCGHDTDLNAAIRTQ